MNKEIVHTSINFQRVFKIAAVCSLVFIYLIQWGRMITTPTLRTGTDFMAFYAAGRVAQEHGFSRVYNIDLQQGIEQGVLGFPLARRQVLLYNHVPYLTPILALLVDSDHVGSFLRWAGLMLGIYIVVASFLLVKTISSGGGSYYTFLAGAFLFFPFFHSLLLGQDTAILFFGSALWCVGILKKKDWLAAAGLALTTVRPHICLALAIPLLFTHRRIFWRFFVIAALLTLTSVLMIGREGVLGFLDLLQISASGTWFGMNEAAMSNMVGLIIQALHSLHLSEIHLLGWVGYALGIVAASILWIRAGRLDGWLLSITLVLALFFAPHLHYHDLTLLVIPLLFALTRMDSGKSQMSLALIPLGLSLFLLVTKSFAIIPYVLYFVVLWLLVKSRKQFAQ